MYIAKKQLTLHTFLLTIVATLLLVSCGYMPVSHHTRALITEPLFVVVKISKKDPENVVILKDEVRQMLIRRLGTKVTTDSSAPSRLTVSYDGISYTALSYDINGYVSRYRANVTTVFELRTAEGITKKHIKTTQEADVNPSAIESSRAKRDAIKECSRKALDQFVAYIASKSLR